MNELANDIINKAFLKDNIVTEPYLFKTRSKKLLLNLATLSFSFIPLITQFLHP